MKTAIGIRVTMKANLFEKRKPQHLELEPF